jgi:hypothetical protein
MCCASFKKAQTVGKPVGNCEVKIRQLLPFYSAKNSVVSF